MGENEILISFDEDPNIGMMDKQKNEKSMVIFVIAFLVHQVTSQLYILRRLQPV